MLVSGNSLFQQFNVHPFLLSMGRLVAFVEAVITTLANTFLAMSDFRYRFSDHRQERATKVACILASPKLAFVRLPISFLTLAVTCSSLTLGNGTVSGQCNGNFNDTCTYASCNTGFYLSSTGSATRTCNQSGLYSGDPMMCLRMFRVEVS